MREDIERMVYGAEDINEMYAKALEQRARKLLEWKIFGKGETPNPFVNTEKIAEELQFLIDSGYVISRGQTSKSLDYEVTEEGKKWALKD